MLRVWLRVIRVRFLLASVLAVSAGLAIHWWQSATIDIIGALITLAGILALHASVDLLNDYWDFRRGIDTATRRTKMSGGTGVLPEGLLEPSAVYRAGVAFLIIGSLIGCYFILVNGWIIAVLLGFAIIAIYFYSTRIVDSGLAEVFVAIKGTMIVLGTYYIQSGMLSIEPGLAGIIVGILSSLVLFVASFPDHDADKQKGRKTLVIMAGKKRASILYWVFVGLCYMLLVAGVFTGIFPHLSLMTLAALPLAVKAGIGLGRNHDKIQELVPFMTMTLSFGRIAGALFVVSFIVSSYINHVFSYRLL